jgi:tetratricopeptide (TPR) repeat protein
LWRRGQSVWERSVVEAEVETPMSADLYSPIRAATCRVDSSTMTGTGFLIAPGRIVTCRHVVAKEAAESLRLIFVWTQDGTEMQEEETYPVLSVALAPEGGSDLALLEIEPAASSARKPLRLGQALLGRPFLCWGYPGLQSESVRCGLPNFGDVVSLTGTAGQPRLALKTSMTVKVGDSGSPVVQSGPLRVVGVISQSIEPDDEGIAVPVDQLEPNFPGTSGWALVAPYPGGVEGPTPLRWKGNARRASRTFVGRQADLVELDRQLSEGGKVAVQAAISGLAGIGKTELALQYLRHGPDPLRFPGGWIWLDASQDLAGQWAQLAPELGIPPGSMEPRQLAPAVLHRMESRPRTLLVLDNAESWGDLQAHLPSEESGHALLVTTRERGFGGAQFASQLELGVLRAPEARELLRRTMGARAEKHPEEVEILVETFGGHALALEVAGAYLGRHPGVQAEEMAAGLPKGVGKRDLEGVQYGKTFSVMIEDLLARLTQHGSAAGQLFPLLGLFGEAPAPVGLLLGVWERVGGGAFDVAFETLEALHLLDRVGTDGWATHRLTRAEARERLGGEGEVETRGRRELARGLFIELRALGDFDFDSYARLKPHIEVAAGWTPGIEEVGDLLQRAQQYPWRLGDSHLAKSWAERALQIHETVSGTESRQIATDRSNLASILLNLGDLEGARREVEESLRVNRRILGDDHPNVATNHTILEVILHSLGDLDGARGIAEEALRIDRKALGDDHPDVATDRSNLATILKDLGDLEGARQEVEEALRIDRKALGDDHLYVATDRAILASILKTAGDLEGARREAREAVRIALLQPTGIPVREEILANWQKWLET